jgi:outer membrane protein OmpA-like peptidoglycan-associated protein
MSFQIPVITLFVFLLTFTGWSQTPPPHDETVPIYHVTVVDRTISAVNYQYRGGPTQIDFQGTVLLPQAKGDAVVESKSGRTDIDARIEHLESPARFGAEYLTYVLWAITPEGHVKNLGEVMADASDKAHLHVTTDLQTFGLIVTAEPYNSVRLPSDVVVAENRVRPDTIGGTEPIHARFELLPRGSYTYNVPADLRALNNGPKVSMDKYERMVEIYQAQNAVQIAQSQGADRYAPDVLAKAEQELANARQLETNRAGRSMVVTAARTAAQTAEDARELTFKRKQDAEIALTQDRAERDRKLREEAEAKAREARAQADADREALEAERAQRAALTAPPAPPPPQPYIAQPYVEPPATHSAVEPDVNRQTAATRAALLQQLRASVNGAVEVIDAPRGVVLMIPDADFSGDILKSSIASILVRVPPVVARIPGLAVEVDGYTDLAGGERESIAAERAGEVRAELVRAGFSGGTVTARGMGASHPIGSNSSAAGREQNRRVEIVISGSAIGNLPLWDKSYTLSLESLER